jgi:hypothetical protein
MPEIITDPIYSYDTGAREVRHYQINGKYRISLKRADTKGIDGFTCEACSDDIAEVEAKVRELYDYAIGLTKVDAKIGTIP